MVGVDREGVLGGGPDVRSGCSCGVGVKLAPPRLGVRAKIYALQKARVPSSPATAQRLKRYALHRYKKCVVAERLAVNDYKTCLYKGKTIYGEQFCMKKRNMCYT